MFFWYKSFYINKWLNFFRDSFGTYVGLIHIMDEWHLEMRIRITYQKACYTQNSIIWLKFNFDCDTPFDWLKKMIILRLRFVHPTFRLRDERSNLLRHRCSLQYLVFYAHVPYAFHASIWKFQISMLSLHFWLSKK